MAAPRQISRDFHSSEFPGWSDLTEEEAQRAERFVRTFLQPIRRRWGRIVVTSYRRSSGTHSRGAVDFVPVAADMREVWEWAATYLSGRFGDLILEPPPFGGDTTGHIHATPWGVGGAGDVLEEVDHDTFELGMVRTPLLLLVFFLAAALAILPAL